MITNNFYNNFIFISLLCLTTITSTMHTDICISEKIYFQTYGQKVLFYDLVTDLIRENESPEQLIKVFAASPRPTHSNLNKPDLSFTGERGNTLLHVAAEYDHHAILTLLLENGANPNKKNHFNYTPFGVAIQSQSRDCCIELIEYGATKESMYVIQSLSTPGKRFCELYRYKGATPKSEISKKYFAFMAPVHSALLNKELALLYQHTSADQQGP